ncbi:hypothetical protein D3C78_580570 [compost metagenome]
MPEAGPYHLAIELMKILIGVCHAATSLLRYFEMSVDVRIGDDALLQGRGIGAMYRRRPMPRPALCAEIFINKIA